MNSKTFGLALIVLGILLILYEYWFYYCSMRFFDANCYFPLLPADWVRVPIYSIVLLVFGLLVYFGNIEYKEEKSE